MPPKVQRPAKGVTISGLTVRGIKYVVEFISEREGRAYFLTTEGTKGAYAGKFILSPIQILPTIAEANVRASNERPKSASSPKPATPKATPAAPAPKPATPKATPAAPAAKPATPKATPAAPAPKPATAIGFFEKQEGLGCGRHALNNLLGERIFVKGTQAEGVAFPPPAPPYSLQGICAMVSNRLVLHGIREACLTSENYDVNTMVAALDYLGYRSEQIPPSYGIPEGKEYLGLLINLGVVQGKPKHWVALRFKSRAPNGTVTYTLYDSLYQAPVETTLAEYLKKRPSVYTIKVLLPKGPPSHPYERIDELPYVEEAVPVLPPVKIEKNQCPEFFDPCTKQSLGRDPAVLQRRVDEITARMRTGTGGTRNSRKSNGKLTRKSRNK